MFGKLKMRTKVAGGFALALAFCLAVGGIAYVSASRIGARLDDVATAKFPSAQALAEMVEAQALAARNLNGTFMELLPLRDPVREGAHKAWRDAIDSLDRAAVEYEALPHGDEARELWKRAVPLVRTWQRETRVAHEAILAWEAAAADGRPEAARLRDQAYQAWRDQRTALAPAQAALGAVVEQTKKDVAAGRKAGQEAVGTGIAWIVAALVAGTTLLVCVALVLGRSVDAVIRALVAESRKLTDAAGKGQLRVRGEAAAVNLEFRPVVEGMNATMDAFQKPIDVTVDYVTRISRGDLPPVIADRYEGDFDRIKLALNGCIAAVSGLSNEMNALSAAAVEGKLSTRADAARHEGDFRKIVEGVNATLDAVMKPIEEAASVLEKLAARDLTARVKGSYQGEHARIKEALNGTAEALHESLAQVAQAVTQVSAAAGQIASSSQAVADGASEQASSLEETSSSLESMASMTKQASENAQQANGLAQMAKAAAAEGGAAMEQMTGAMGKIKASAEGTSQIIKDINEIAFQTNLLALNAAVEAARAGEAGRGFAVVAEEVRSLAMRSKEAAQKTEELIRQSVKEAGEGEITARHVSEKLGEIASSISKVSDIVAEIAASAKEQSTGIDQVNKAVGQMDRVTQQNAANSEESSSAAAELSGQSEELAAMVGTFQLERAAATVKPVAPQPRRAAPAPAPRPARAAPRARHGNGISLRPEDVIPMESDPAFKEF